MFKISSDREELNGLTGSEVSRTARSITLNVSGALITVSINDVRPV